MKIYYIYPFLLFTFLLLSALTFGEDTQTGRNRAQSGEVLLDLKNDSQDPYLMNQTQALAYFKDLQKKIDALVEGNFSPVPELNERALHHLMGVYLYCSVKKGVCPGPLDAILETDIINSKLNKSSACPNMTSFWKIWIKNDMENRQKYLTQIAYINDTDTFKNKVRPKYLKCRATVTSEVDSSLSDLAFFKQRYANDAAARTAINSLVSMLEELQKKEINVFVAMDLMK